MENIETSIDIKYLIKKEKSKFIYRFIKRCLDLIGSIGALLVLSPLFLAIGILVRLDSKGNIFFAHDRLGKDGEIIKVYKFRTMLTNAQQILDEMPDDMKREFEKNFKFVNDSRITKLGKFLRESSLDELPQLVNIMKGNMSIVGPRPIVSKEIIKYGKCWDRLLSIKPGLTGNWQVSGRSDTTYEDRVKFDMDYIDKRSFWTDMVIILKTFGVVIKRVGAK
ncbi:sugar transferase [Clostridium psychrophilum]|uniref:sugar transferase n=1 Tax=Clostridium psychrophilum TaxID=132926 RepID=UPI001C0D7EE2|nr:sugar transferase [Clostridium psychrophilum]MBU3182034.1 sugar transferase [Clostridium psychrophilum]